MLLINIIDVISAAPMKSLLQLLIPREAICAINHRGSAGDGRAAAELQHDGIRSLLSDLIITTLHNLGPCPHTAGFVIVVLYNSTNLRAGLQVGIAFM